MRAFVAITTTLPVSVEMIRATPIVMDVHCLFPGATVPRKTVEISSD
jgi:hypothetical protein